MTNLYTPLAQPLDDEDKRTINAALDRLKELDELILRSEQAGLDVTAQKTQKAALETKLRNIKRAFFPGG